MPFDDAGIAIGMTLEDIARKLDTIGARMLALEQRVEGGFIATTHRFATLESKVDDGFAASRMRDVELHRLTRFGLEADEVIADSISRRFDEALQKHDEQITLLKDVIVKEASH